VKRKTSLLEEEEDDTYVDEVPEERILEEQWMTPNQPETPPQGCQIN